MNREGIVVARCTVGRLMKLQGLRGEVRGKRIRTTIADKSAPRPLNLSAFLWARRLNNRLSARLRKSLAEQDSKLVHR